MKTYLALIETVSGNQHIQLAAANTQDARSQVEARVQAAGDTSVRYTIQEQLTVQAPETMSALLNASGGLISCILALAIAEYRLRRYFKG